MATFYKRGSKNHGTRWTARVRIQGREITKTFSRLADAKSWTRQREIAIENGTFVATGNEPIFADLVDDFIAGRTAARRPPGKTFASALARLRDAHGLERASALDGAFWRSHALKRIAAGVTGQTVASELAYAGSVLRRAQRDGKIADASGPATARASLREDGTQVTSSARERRISDAEITAIFEWIDANATRTSVPLRDIVEFALATGMRRGEILALKFSDISGRVAHIKRKHPRDPNRMEDVPLLRQHNKWPRWDALAIIERQPQPAPDARVFPCLADTVGFWFEQAAAGANLQGVVFHLLRHECLSRLAERGFDPLRLAKVSGHRDMRNVKRYAKLDAASLADE
jgi:integrase